MQWWYQNHGLYYFVLLDLLITLQFSYSLPLSLRFALGICFRYETSAASLPLGKPASETATTNATFEGLRRLGMPGAKNQINSSYCLSTGNYYAITYWHRLFSRWRNAKHDVTVRLRRETMPIFLKVWLVGNSRLSFLLPSWKKCK